MNRVRVEVFPLEPDRWISEIDAPLGTFSTEVKSAGEVRADVEASARAVLSRDDVGFDLVDDLGRPYALPQPGWAPLRPATSEVW